MVINTLYFDEGILKSARKAYVGQSPHNIRLENFFQKSIFSLLQKKMHNLNYHLKFHPYKHRYLTAKSKDINFFLNGRHFKNLIKKIFGIKKFKIEHEIRKFEPGSYTLLHDAEKEKPGMDFVIDFSKSSESFGGFTVYMTETEELLILKPKPNTLSFIKRDKRIIKYTKYVGHRAKHALIQVVGTITKK